MPKPSEKIIYGLSSISSSGYNILILEFVLKNKTSTVNLKVYELEDYLIFYKIYFFLVRKFNKIGFNVISMLLFHGFIFLLSMTVCVRRKNLAENRNSSLITIVWPSRAFRIIRDQLRTPNGQFLNFNYIHSVSERTSTSQAKFAFQVL